MALVRVSRLASCATTFLDACHRLIFPILPFADDAYNPHITYCLFYPYFLYGYFSRMISLVKEGLGVVGF